MTTPLTELATRLLTEYTSEPPDVTFIGLWGDVRILARTVLAVESALDGLERDTDAWENATRATRGDGLGPDESAILCARETENRIRTALNGGDAA